MPDAASPDAASPDAASPDTASTDTTGQNSAAQTVPTKEKCVIIGAGFVGYCLVGHLCRLGWTDIVQID